MIKKKNTKERNQSEWFYLILKECVQSGTLTTAIIDNKYKLSEDSIYYRELEKFNFISVNRDGGNIIELLPQGFSTYLSISSQKQSAELAKKATNKSTWALLISILSFIASIVFNIISMSK